LPLMWMSIIQAFGVHDLTIVCAYFTLSFSSLTYSNQPHLSSTSLFIWLLHVSRCIKFLAMTIQQYLPRNTKLKCSRCWEAKNRCPRWIWCCWAGLYFCYQISEHTRFFKRSYRQTLLLPPVTPFSLFSLCCRHFDYAALILFYSIIFIPLLLLRHPNSILFYSISAAPTATAPPCTRIAPK